MPEADEDHLGVALIQPGGSRYEQMKVAESRNEAREALAGREAATRVEPRNFTSLAIEILQGTFFIQENRKEGKEHENHIEGWLCKGVCREQKRL